ncbi:glycerol-3-phosphate 1-O-acyltransferase PlsY [Anaerohalosphaeraceae bacterium U12dextr]
MIFAVLAIAAYLVGAIPFGLLIARTQGVDLRKVGSGNIGATNVTRTLGKKWGYLCFAMDVLKGLIPMLLVPAFGLINKEQATLGQLSLWLLVGCLAIVGHVFPVYLGFKGGKGVATSLGVVLGLWPYYTVCGLITFAVWGIALWIWRYVSLASILAAIIFPVSLAILTFLLTEWELGQLWPLFIVAILMPLLVIARHAENIKRLMEGSEHKIGRKSSI